MPAPSLPLQLPAFAAPDAPSLPLWLVEPAELEAFLAAAGAEFAPWLRATGFDASLGALCLLPGADGQLAGAIAGLGDARARQRQRFGIARAVTALPGGCWHLAFAAPAPAELLSGISLAWLLASYRFERYRPGRKATEPARLRVPEGVDKARLLAMATGEFLTRDLINTPAHDLGPEELEQAFTALAQEFGATSKVIRGDDLLAQNFPLIHAVGRASPRAPRLLELNWGSEGPHLTLVGKGVCFDTGGLDLKPASGMLLMKKDMGGAATTMGLARMIMALNLPLRLRLLVPAVENVISGNALKPKDIITSRKGLTVEVNDTDAEGRLILADTLAYASEQKTDAIISMATLTGAARVAVGPDLAPYWAMDEAMAAALEQGARAGFDPVWRLPFHEAYEPVIEPGIADLDNAPGFGFAGAITAALFLRRFADHPRYMHFDIYGHSPSDAPARPKGGTGQGARALLNALPGMLGL
ncbi:leucyl aminopeptidase family protein [Pseudogemmobacter faecipullorum]|uniref:Leucyl aminopeptidase family protein n=1 Tax=Pseudogemmobacter faecipullorum TaxID=2755041 RepID=A0ABS8CH24_9RHOB|nr:leucyl aminopeptidase family protein [Pseudogemmobacter faecipullorum]MCB5408667.1 leucyl aminopeptidase family protein [Pseudogemmobacter faecipullorum]